MSSSSRSPERNMQQVFGNFKLSLYLCSDEETPDREDGMSKHPIEDLALQAHLDGFSHAHTRAHTRVRVLIS